MLYFIASSGELYKRFNEQSVEQALRGVNTRGLDMESYIVLSIAKDILMQTSYTSSEDYEDEEIESNEQIIRVFWKGEKEDETKN